MAEADWDTTKAWCPFTNNESAAGRYACQLPAGHETEHDMRWEPAIMGEQPQETTQLLGEVSYTDERQGILRTGNWLSQRPQVRVTVRFPSGSEVVFEQDEPTEAESAEARTIAAEWAQRFWR